MRHGGYGRSVALALQALLVPLFGISPDASPFLVFFAAFIAAAWFGGLGPGLVAVGLSALLSRYFSLSPQYSFEIRGFGEGLRLVVFVLEGAVISLLMEAMHAAGRRAKALETTRRGGELQVRAHQSSKDWCFVAVPFSSFEGRSRTYMSRQVLGVGSVTFGRIRPGTPGRYSDANPGGYRDHDIDVVRHRAK